MTVHCVALSLLECRWSASCPLKAGRRCRCPLRVDGFLPSVLHGVACFAAKRKARGILGTMRPLSLLPGTNRRGAWTDPRPLTDTAHCGQHLVGTQRLPEDASSFRSLRATFFLGTVAAVLRFYAAAFEQTRSAESGSAPLYLRSSWRKHSAFCKTYRAPYCYYFYKDDS